MSGMIFGADEVRDNGFIFGAEDLGWRSDLHYGATIIRDVNHPDDVFAHLDDPS